MRPRISIRGYVRRSVRWSVGPSVVCVCAYMHAVGQGPHVCARVCMRREWARVCVHTYVRAHIQACPGACICAPDEVKPWPPFPSVVFCSCSGGKCLFRCVLASLYEIVSWGRIVGRWALFKDVLTLERKKGDITWPVLAPRWRAIFRTWGRIFRDLATKFAGWWSQRVCPSVHPSVRMSIPPSVSSGRNAFVLF